MSRLRFLNNINNKGEKVPMIIFGMDMILTYGGILILLTLILTS